MAAAEPHLQERIAVVFIHGQGEQTPMTDVINLAMSVWRTDIHAIGESKLTSAATPLAPVYSVPVYDGEASEQRRIITESDAGLPRVDFYQFYWADLLQGSRFAQLWKWFVRLIQKDPRTNVVPGALLPLRRLTLGVAWGVCVWSIVLGCAVAGALLRPCTAKSALVVGAWFGLLVALVVLTLTLLLAFGANSPRLRLPPPLGAVLLDRARRWTLVIPIALVLCVVLATARLVDLRLTYSTSDVVCLLMTLGVLGAAWGIVRRKALNNSFLVALVLIAVATCVGPFAEALRGPPTLLSGLLSPALKYLLAATIIPAVLIGALFHFLSEAFLVPVMTESARMFTPSPDNIPNQDRIRERGVALLQALHDSPERYDRIIVLAHSLGTAVGYGLLTYYWGKVRAGLDHVGSATAREAAIAAALPVVGLGEPTSQHLQAWRNAARAYGDALKYSKATDGSRELSAWRVSDFITIGSPLTYAAFLLEATDQLFIDEVATYKKYAVNPPYPTNPATSGYDFTLAGQPHHAALFAATTWTNLYFPARGLIWGDLIGGPLRGAPRLDACEPPRTAPHLGWGVLDVALPHDPRINWFAHNDYWVWEDGYDVGDPPGHIEALRYAFHFFIAPDEADQLLLAVAP